MLADKILKRIVPMLERGELPQALDLLSELDFQLVPEDYQAIEQGLEEAGYYVGRIRGKWAFI